MSVDSALTEAMTGLARTPRLLVALDFDGTLAPLVDEPMSARMLPVARTALETLSTLPDTTVALVSGRTLAHLREIAEHDDASQVYLAGSHGAEFWHPGSTSASAVVDEEAPLRDELTARVEDLVSGVDGAWIEHKQFGFGLHTRLAQGDAASSAAAAVDALVAERAPTWRRRTGQDILEFAYRHEGKDSAVRTLRDLVGATAVLFAGDDVTDEDALATLSGDDVGIRVGGGETQAPFRAPDAAALADLLERLATARAAH